MTTKAKVHVADFQRVTEHGSEFFRVTCRETGAVAMHWPSYIREGSPLTVWEKGECDADEHLNAKFIDPETAGTRVFAAAVAMVTK